MPTGLDGLKIRPCLRPGLSQRQRQRQSMPLPEDLRWPAPHDPLVVLGGEVHGAVEGGGPLQMGGKVVRVRDDDGGDAAELGDAGDRRVVEVRDAVPEDVAGGRAAEIGGLADAELGGRVDGDERVRVGFVRDEVVAVSLAGL